MCSGGQKHSFSQTSLLKIHIVLLRKCAVFSKNHRKLEVGGMAEGERGKDGAFEPMLGKKQLGSLQLKYQQQED